MRSLFTRISHIFLSIMIRYSLCFKIWPGSLHTQLTSYTNLVDLEYPDLESKKRPFDLYHVNILTFYLRDEETLDVLTTLIQHHLHDENAAMFPVHVAAVEHLLERRCNSVVAYLYVPRSMYFMRRTAIRAVVKLGGSICVGEDCGFWKPKVTLYKSTAGTDSRIPSALFRLAPRLYKADQCLDYISSLRFCALNDSAYISQDSDFETYSICINRLYLDCLSPQQQQTS